VSERRGQPPVFWIAIGAIVVIVVITVIGWTRMDAERLRPTITGAAIALVLTVVIIAGFAVSLTTRMRWIAERFPHALRIPIVTSSELAAGSARLAEELHDDDLILRPSKYAAVAVDAEGVHVISSTDPEPPVVPASSVSVTGLSRVMLGYREFDAIVLSVATETGPIEFPLTPMRLKGNVLRALTPDEVQRVAKSIDEALKGRVPQPAWPY
jgi:hypothetical protein